MVDQLNSEGLHLQNVLATAVHEIRQLRRDNAVLGAKVEVLDIFKAALLGVPNGMSHSPDVTHEIERILNAMQKPASV